MRANSNLFHPILPHLDKWIVGIEDLRLPRNIIAHMNYPNSIDMTRIDVFYADCLILVSEVEKHIKLIIP